MKLSITHLRAAGMTDAQIVKAMEEAEAERREQNRKRQQNYRARNASRSDGCDGRDNEREKEPSLLVEKKEKKKKKALSPIAADWQPSDDDAWWARTTFNLTDQQIREQCESFRDHALCNDRTFANISAGFRNWVRNSMRRQLQRSGYQQSVKDRNREIMDDLNSYIDREATKRGARSEADPQGDLQLSDGQSDAAEGVSRGACATVVELFGGRGDGGDREGDGHKSDVPAAGPVSRTTLR